MPVVVGVADHLTALIADSKLCYSHGSAVFPEETLTGEGSCATTYKSLLTYAAKAPLPEHLRARLLNAKFP